MLNVGAKLTTEKLAVKHTASCLWKAGSVPPPKTQQALPSALWALQAAQVLLQERLRFSLIPAPFPIR